MNKKAILVVSFGTTVRETLEKSIESVEQHIEKSFKEYDVYRAFTSRIVVKKLKNEYDMEVDNEIEAIQKLINKNYQEVIVQPLHIIPGYEYDKIKYMVDEYQEHFDKLVLSQPLLYENEDYVEMVEFMRKNYDDKDKTYVLMGHGTEHFSNACYSCMQSHVDENDLSIYIGTVEGYPELDNIMKYLKGSKDKEIVLTPFMLVAGDHALNDMAGEDDDSWKNILIDKGFEVSSKLIGLGEYDDIKELYVNKINRTIA